MQVLRCRAQEVEAEEEAIARYCMTSLASSRCSASITRLWATPPSHSRTRPEATRCVVDVARLCCAVPAAAGAVLLQAARGAGSRIGGRAARRAAAGGGGGGAGGLCARGAAGVTRRCGPTKQSSDFLLRPFSDPRLPAQHTGRRPAKRRSRALHLQALASRRRGLAKLAAERAAAEREYGARPVAAPPAAEPEAEGQAGEAASGGKRVAAAERGAVAAARAAAGAAAEVARLQGERRGLQVRTDGLQHYAAFPDPSQCLRQQPPDLSWPVPACREASWRRRSWRALRSGFEGHGLTRPDLASHAPAYVHPRACVRTLRGYIQGYRGYIKGYIRELACAPSLRGNMGPCLAQACLRLTPHTR
jgi:hypothetical protein